MNWAADIHDPGDRPYRSSYYEGLAFDAAREALDLRPADASEDWLPSADQVLDNAYSRVSGTWWPITESEAEDAIRVLAVWRVADGRPFSWEWHPQAFAPAESSQQRIKARAGAGGRIKSPLAISTRVELSVAPEARDRAMAAFGAGGDTRGLHEDLPWADDSGTFCAVFQLPRRADFAAQLVILRSKVDSALKASKISYNVLSVQIGSRLHSRLYRRPVGSSKQAPG